MKCVVRAGGRVCPESDGAAFFFLAAHAGPSLVFAPRSIARRCTFRFRLPRCFNRGCTRSGSRSISAPCASLAICGWRLARFLELSVAVGAVYDGQSSGGGGQHRAETYMNAKGAAPRLSRSQSGPRPCAQVREDRQQMDDRHEDNTQREDVRRAVPQVRGPTLVIRMCVPPVRRPTRDGGRHPSRAA